MSSLFCFFPTNLRIREGNCTWHMIIMKKTLYNSSCEKVLRLDVGFLE